MKLVLIKYSTCFYDLTVVLLKYRRYDMKKNSDKV